MRLPPTFRRLGLERVGGREVSLRKGLHPAGSWDGLLAIETPHNQPFSDLSTGWISQSYCGSGFGTDDFVQDDLSLDR